MWTKSYWCPRGNQDLTLYTKETLKPWSGWSLTWNLIDMARAMHLESILTTWNQAVKVYASVATLNYLKANGKISFKFVVLFWTRSNGHFLWGSFFWTNPTLSLSPPSLFFCINHLWSIWKNCYWLYRDFRVQVQNKSTFLNCFFNLYCMLYFFFFPLLAGYRAKTSWVFNPLVQFLKVYKKSPKQTSSPTSHSYLWLYVRRMSCKWFSASQSSCVFSDNMQISPILRVPGPYMVACQSHTILGKHHSQIELTGQSRDGSPEEEQMSPHCRRVSSWRLALSRVLF